MAIFQIMINYYFGKNYGFTFSILKSTKLLLSVLFIDLIMN